MQAHDNIDPLEEIGDLVGKTLDILGGGADGGAAAAGKPAPAANKKEMPSGQLDDIDLLGAGAAQDATDPLSFGGGLQHGDSYDQPEQQEFLQTSAQYEDLVDGSAASPRAQPGPPPAHGRGPGAGGAAESAGSGHADGAGPAAAGADTEEAAGSSGLELESHIRVTIREPEKVETVSSLGLKTHYIQYVVRTDSNVPGFIAVGMEVKRRFSDFDALHKHLKQDYRGYFVPPLPEKSFLAGKMAQDEFIRLRRADLQAFIKALTCHPVLRESEALKIFLLQPGDLTRNPAWTYLVNPPASLKQQKSGMASSVYAPADQEGMVGVANAGVATLKAGLGSWMTWMKSSYAQFVPPKREVAEDEAQLRQAKELLSDLEKLLELAVEAARSLCAHQDALCADVRELGRTFGMLSRFEEAVQAKVGQYTEQGASAASRATDLNRLAYGSAKQHGVWKTLSIKTAASLVTLHDYWVLVPEAIHALEAREAALTQLHLLQDELAAKQHAQAQANTAANKRGNLSTATTDPSPAEKRAYQLGTAIAQLEGQIAAAQKEYEMLKERNQSELSRLSLEREADFKRMMTSFARTQAELIQASAEMWLTCAKQFEQQGQQALPEQE